MNKIIFLLLMFFSSLAFSSDFYYSCSNGVYYIAVGGYATPIAPCNDPLLNQCLSRGGEPLVGNTCSVPPIVCTSPQILNSVSQTCYNPPVCTSSQVLDTSVTPVVCKSLPSCDNNPDPNGRCIPECPPISLENPIGCMGLDTTPCSAPYIEDPTVIPLINGFGSGQRTNHVCVLPVVCDGLKIPNPLTNSCIDPSVPDCTGLETYNGESNTCDCLPPAIRQNNGGSGFGFCVSPQVNCVPPSYWVGDDLSGSCHAPDTGGSSGEGGNTPSGTGTGTSGTGTGTSSTGTGCLAGDACDQTIIRKSTADTALNTKEANGFLKTISEFKICPTDSTAIYCALFGNSLPDSPVQTKEITVDFEKKMTSAGSCPSPFSFGSAHVGSHSVSYQPFCDFAEKIHDFVLAMSSLAALYIISSSVRKA
jgi:hypothetical protein